MHIRFGPGATRKRTCHNGHLASGLPVLPAAGATGGKPPVGLRLSAGNGGVLIEVWDGNPRPPEPTELEDGIPPLDQEGGRGLFLVETLSERWGWYPTRNPEGKVTWCEISAPPALRGLP